jgi:carbonic anhydrase/acetyltransferase-like protein (isoleucine patch superfamily)
MSAENKKYKLVESDIEGLFRVVALVSFGIVSAGEQGGYVESECNLSLSGDAWVSGNAQVYGDARVYGDACVSGNAQVYGDACVSGNAQVYGDARVSGDAWVSGDAQVSGNAQVYGDACVSGNAQVYGDARVSGNAQVYGDARVSGNAQVYGDARVSGDAQVTKQTYFLQLEYSVTITDNHLRAGCQQLTFEEWESLTQDQIHKMDGDRAAKFYPHLIAIMNVINAARGLQ